MDVPIDIKSISDVNRDGIQTESNKPQEMLWMEKCGICLPFLLIALETFCEAETMNHSSTATKIINDVSKMWNCVFEEQEKITPIEKNVFFELYTRKNREKAEQFVLENGRISIGTSKNSSQMNTEGTIQSRYFNIANRDIKILIHGYAETGWSTKMMDIKTVYLNKGKYNVIMVDWGRIANGTCYVHVVKHVPKVGRLIGRFLNRLVVIAGVSTATVHVIGFSLGAHVAGFVGKTANLGIIKRITGLDPALPMFIGKDPKNRLDRGDATYVDVIHTCAGILGIKGQIGHADFYPNGGFHQTGCEDVLCSHSRAPIYYRQSIVTPSGFKALRCDSWKHFLHGKCEASSYALMGDASDWRSKGIFYLRTSNNTPYILSFEGLGPFSKFF